MFIARSEVVYMSIIRKHFESVLIKMSTQCSDRRYTGALPRES